MSGSFLRRKLTRLLAFVVYPMKVLAVARFSGAQVVVPTTNPFTLPWVCVAARFFHGRPVVPLVYDLYPDAMEAAGLPATGLLSKLTRAMNRWWLRRADGVVYIGRRMAHHANARYGEPALWTVLQTGADPREFTEQPDREPSSPSGLRAWCRERFVVSYVGNLGMMHDWQTLAEGLPAFLSRAKNEGLRVGVVLAATGPHAGMLAERLAECGGESIRVTEALGDEEWAHLLMDSDVSLVTLIPSARHTCVPSKAFSAAAAGCALAAITDPDSDLADLVTDEGCGVVIEPGSGLELAERLLAWARDPEALTRAQENAKTASRERYDVAVLRGRWDAFLDQVMAERSANRALSWLKRGVDLVLGSTALILLSPAILVVALAIRLKMGSPVFFHQDRPGHKGRIFKLVKFRTMGAPRHGEEAPEHDALRLTPLGNFLRASSLDELPTLYNVLRGEMSLVGPRPLLTQYLDRYSPEQARRHDARPGVTGWAQVHGRNSHSWEEKFEHDVWYVDHRTFWLDLRILFMTLGKVFARSGIHQEGHATMPEFRASEGIHDA